VLEADNVSALAENPGSDGYGLHSNNTANLRGGHYVARGGGDAYGLYISSGAADLSAVGITAQARDAVGNNYGVYNLAGTIRISQSRLAGDDYAVRQQTSGALYLGACLIDDAVSSTGGLIKYFHCFNANFDAYP
jgi:hypothetical protein